MTASVGEGVGKGEPPLLLGVWCKLVQLLCKIVWRSLKKLKTELPEKAISFLGIHLKKTKTLIGKYMPTSIFTEALLTIPKIRNNLSAR